MADLESCCKADSSELIRMGPLLTCLSKSLPKIRKPNSAFIHFKDVTPSNIICCMKTWFLQHSHRRNVSSMSKRSLLCIFPILSYPSCTKQNTTRQSTHSNIDNTLLASTAAALGMLITRPILIASSTALSVDPKENPHPLVLSKTFILVAWQVFWRDYLLPNCKLAWKTWSVWCGSWKVYPFQCTVNYVLEYSSS